MYLIEEQESLDQFLNDIKTEECIAIDTEFARVKTYYPQLCLIQIATPSLIACIDCLSGMDLSELWKIIYLKNVEKVMHSCSQDLEIFFLANSKVPENIFDTQIAASFIGYSSQVGFKELLENELNVRIDKSQTRSDWSKRPLANAQLQYAFEDVEDLIELSSSIKDKLIRLERYDWVIEECNDLTYKKTGLMDTSNAWKRTKGINKLKSSQRTVGIQLSEWREEKAALKDIPRKWLIQDQDIITISKINVTKKELERIIRNRHFNNNDLDEVYEIINNPNDIFSNIARPPRRKRINDNDLNLINEYLESKSQDLEINKEILASKKDIIHFISERDGKICKGWRRTMMFEDLENVLA